MWLGLSFDCRIIGVFSTGLDSSLCKEGFGSVKPVQWSRTCWPHHLRFNTWIACNTWKRFRKLPAKATQRMRLLARWVVSVTCSRTVDSRTPTTKIGHLVPVNDDRLAASAGQMVRVIINELTRLIPDVTVLAAFIQIKEQSLAGLSK